MRRNVSPGKPQGSSSPTSSPVRLSSPNRPVRPSVRLCTRVRSVDRSQSQLQGEASQQRSKALEEQKNRETQDSLVRRLQKRVLLLTKVHTHAPTPTPLHVFRAATTVACIQTRTVTPPHKSLQPMPSGAGTSNNIKGPLCLSPFSLSLFHGWPCCPSSPSLSPSLSLSLSTSCTALPRTGT